MKMRIILLVLLCLPLPALAEGEPGLATLILEVDGEGSTVRKKSRIEESARVGARVYPGEIVSTGPRATLKLLTADGSLVKLGFGSRLQIEESTVVERIATWTANLILGYARALVTPQPTKATRFRMKTPAASVGVRGTEFVLVHHEASESSYVYTIEGSVVFGKAGCEASRSCLEVRGGETSVLRKGTDPSRPSPFDVKELTRGKADPQDSAARLSLFKPSRAVDGATGSGEPELKKLVASSSEELAADQDKALGRTKQERIAVNQSIANGTFHSVMDAAESYLAATDKSSAPLEGADEIVAATMNEKHQLGMAVLEAEKAGVFVEPKKKTDASSKYTMRTPVTKEQATSVKSRSSTLSSSKNSYNDLVNTSSELSGLRESTGSSSPTRTATTSGSTLSATRLSNTTLSGSTLSGTRLTTTTVSGTTGSVTKTTTSSLTVSTGKLAGATLSGTTTLRSPTLVNYTNLLTESTADTTISRYSGTTLTSGTTTLSRTTISTATTINSVLRTSTATAITRSTGTCYDTKETCKLVPCDAYYKGMTCKGGSKTVCETTKVAVPCR